MTTVVRTRARLPKAKPNIMGVGRRSTGTTTTSSSTAAPTPPPKCATGAVAALSEPPKENISPPPVRRMVNVVARKAATSSIESLLSPSSTRSDIPNELKSSEQARETPETFNNTEVPAMAPPKKIPPTQDKQVQQTTQSIRRVRKNSTRTATENREKEEAVNVRHKKNKLPPDRAKMTMFDLIYWNPSSNPMTYDDVEDRPPLADKVANTPALSTENSERLAEEAVDDPEFVGEANTEEAVSTTELEKNEENSMPVPQVKIGPDGNIILDEQSLVIETSASKSNLSSSPIVYGRQSNTTYASFRNKKQTKTWTDKETAKFYVALSSVGTDFSMMANLFPKRERKELKLKFKREEKFNRALVDKAIRDRQQYDLSIFDDSDNELENVDAESVTATKKARKKQSINQRKKNLRGNGSGDSEKEKPRKRHRIRRTMQEESDSDYEESDKETDPMDLPVQSEAQSQLIDSSENNASIPASRSCENSITDSLENEEEYDEGSEECNPEEALTLDGVLKPTRSGRQPKKRFLFTINNAEPKKRCKNKKLTDDNTEAVFDGCTQPLLAIEQDCSDNTSSSHIIYDEYLTDSFTMDSNEVGLPGTVFLGNAEASMTEQVVTDTKAKQDNIEVYDEFIQDNNVLEGVLKQTRSGRQPKMKSVFTINNPLPKKRVATRPISPSKNVNAHSQMSRGDSSPLQTIMSVSPSQLYLLAEKPSGDGSQVVHFYMMSPPVQPTPVTSAVSPIVTDHDYVLQTLANATGDSVLTLSSDLQTLDPNT